MVSLVPWLSLYNLLMELLVILPPSHGDSSFRGDQTFINRERTKGHSLLIEILWFLGEGKGRGEVLTGRGLEAMCAGEGVSSHNRIHKGSKPHPPAF